MAEIKLDGEIRRALDQSQTGENTLTVHRADSISLEDNLNRGHVPKMETRGEQTF